MCLYVDKTAKPTLAKKDIVVYKLIAKDNKSFFKWFQYEPNKLYRLHRQLKIDNNPKINKFGFKPHESAVAVSKGFHSFATLEDAMHERNIWSECDRSPKIVKFIIPRGAKYYLGYYNIRLSSYVSTSIRSGDLLSL